MGGRARHEPGTSTSSARDSRHIFQWFYHATWELFNVFIPLANCRKLCENEAAISVAFPWKTSLFSDYHFPHLLKLEFSHTHQVSCVRRYEIQYHELQIPLKRTSPLRSLRFKISVVASGNRLPARVPHRHLHLHTEGELQHVVEVWNLIAALAEDAEPVPGTPSHSGARMGEAFLAKRASTA